jgi:hypothetical protein
MFRRSNLHRIINISLMVLSLLVIAVPVLARDKYEAIDAQAFGTGTQMGQNIGITLIFMSFQRHQTGSFSCKHMPRGRTKDSSMPYRR